LGGICGGRSETRRPAVLIVEDEFLIPMEAADIRTAGLDVGQA
jgi:hypothetical protein